MKALFFNSDDFGLVGFTNAIELEPDGWAQLAPYGDFPGVAVSRNSDGTYKRIPAIQRVDRNAAESMVRAFNSALGRLKRFVTGCNIYLGHPDNPMFANEFPDDRPKGVIAGLEAREDGLWCLPVFNNEGCELVESRKAGAFSAHWQAEDAGHEDGRPIFRPTKLRSAGLTNTPNLPVKHIANMKLKRVIIANTVGQALSAALEQHNAENPDNQMTVASLAQAAGIDEATVQQILSGDIQRPPDDQLRALAEALGISFESLMSQLPMQDNPMPPAPPAAANIKAKVIRDLNAQGAALANNATDEEISGAIRKLGQEKASLANQKRDTETQLSSAKADRTRAETNFSNERQARITDLLDQGQADGRITPATRSDWESRLQADFANASAELKQQKPVIKTTSQTRDIGPRKAEIANMQDRREKLQDLVSAEMAKNGGNYDRAFNAVKRDNPALFEAMMQPAGS